MYTYTYLLNICMCIYMLSFERFVTVDNMCICTYVGISSPKLALAVGCLTFLYKGPWWLTGNAPNAAHHLCL